MNKNLLAKLKTLLTGEELLLVGVIVALLLVVSFVLINPVGRMHEQADGIRKQELAEIDKALSNYVILSEDGLPTYDNGNALPTVTQANILSQGIDLARVDNLAGEYLTSIPLDPDGNSYKVGVISGGEVLVGIALSDGSLYTL